MTAPRTLFDKIWDSHVAYEGKDDEPSLLYVDLHLVHEVTSPQPFEGLRLAGRKPRMPGKTVAVPDHNVPTDPDRSVIKDENSRIQLEALERNTQEFGIPYIPLSDIRQGIVHTSGPNRD